MENVYLEGIPRKFKSGLKGREGRMGATPLIHVEINLRTGREGIQSQ